MIDDASSIVSQDFYCHLHFFERRSFSGFVRRFLQLQPRDESFCGAVIVFKELND